MRTIKFRVWDNELKKYRSEKDGDYSLGVLSGTVRGIYGEKFPQMEVEQFTGLHDISGREIYEGDVLNYGTYTGNSELTGKSCNHVVKWYSEHGAFETLALYEKEATGSFLDGSGIIIGNIHENPELCKL